MTSLDQRLTILLLTSCANLALGLAVLAKSPTHRVNQYFALLSSTIAGWTLSIGLVNTYAGTPAGVFWVRAAFAFASLIPISFFLFVSVFPTSRPSPPRSITRLFLISGTIVCVLAATPLIARSSSSLNGVLHVTYGPLHPAFGLYFICSLVYSLAFLYRRLRVLTGIERLQVRYVFLGISLPILGGTITNLLVPLAFGSSQFSQIGPLFSILMISLIAHAIFRYRLMNIRLALRRGFVYLLAISTVSGLFVALLWLGSKVLAARSQLSLGIELLLVVVIAILFRPLKDYVQRWTDRYFFREPYDYQRVVREISRGMAGILDLDSLLRYSCAAIMKTVQPEYVAVYGRDSSGNAFERLVLQSTVGDAPQVAVVESNSALSVYLSKTPHPLLSDRISTNKSPVGVAGLREELRRLQADVVLPIYDEESLSGFFLVGSKRSTDPYFSEDIDLLSTLASQAAIALKNAQLYSQVVLANDYLENILGAIDSAVIAVDREGAVTRFNAAAERLTGLPSSKLRHSSLPDLPRSISRLLHATCSDSQPRTQIETTVSHDSHHRVVPVICSTSPLLDQAGLLLGAVAILSDLTSLKRLEEEKRQVERLASIGALASGLAHEIKNPLVAIKTFAELLPERFSEEDFRNDFSKVAIREIERIDDLVAKLRGLAMPSPQSLGLLDLRTPLEETLALLRAQFEQKQLSLTLDFDKSLPPVAGDAGQLKQLFLNLFVNAIEASEPRGQLFLWVRSRPVLGHQLVAVEIADRGPGIPEDLLNKVFEPFVTTKPQGSGLGLSICQGIAQAHRATIRARNNPNGQGLTVTVEFPASNDTPAAGITH